MSRVGTRRSVMVVVTLLMLIYCSLSIGGVHANAATVGTSGNYMYEVLSATTCAFRGYKAPTYDGDGNEKVYTPAASANGTYTITVPSKIGSYTVTQIGDLNNVGDIINEVTKVVIPSTVTAIKSGVLSRFDSLTTVTFSDTSTMTTITSGMFSNTGITSITIPASVTKIEDSAFSGCYDLKTVTFSSGSKLNTIGAGAFRELPITKIALPMSVTTIGEFAFADCDSLTTVTITSGSKLTTIKSNAFRYDSSLKTIALDNCTSLTTVGAYAFEETALSSITIPASVTKIENGAFSGISSVNSMGDYVAIPVTFATRTSTIKLGTNAFYGTLISSVTIPEQAVDNVSNATSLSASVFNNAQKVVIKGVSHKVVNFDDTDIAQVQAPYGSYVWAAMYKGEVSSGERSAASFVTVNSDVQTDYYSSKGGKVSYTAATVSEKTSSNASGNIVFSMDSIVPKTATAAKNVKMIVTLGGCKFDMTLSNLKGYFGYSDTQSGVVGTIKITAKSGSKLSLKSTITKTYSIQAEKFSDAVISFNTSTDATKGIYSTTYKTYIWKGNTYAIKPTVIVKLNGTTIPSSYYTVTYKNNVGLCKSPSVTVTLNATGQKYYQSGSVTKSFSIKRSIGSCDVKVKGVVPVGGTSTDSTNYYKLHPTASSSPFLGVSSASSSWKIPTSNYIVQATVDSKSGTNFDKSRYTISYSSDALNAFDLGTNIPLGVVTVKVSAKSGDSLLYGSTELSYYTKYNISNFAASNVSMYVGETRYAVSKTVDTNNVSLYYATAFTYSGSAIKPTVSMSFGGVSGEQISSLGGTLSYTYDNNTNASASGAYKDLAKIAVKASPDCNYLYGTRNVYFKIKPMSLTSTMFTLTGNASVNESGQKVYTYTGSAIKPTVSTALKSSDYTVSYSSNTNVSDVATITFTGKGNYTGTVSQKFSIGRVSIKNCTIQFEAATSSSSVSSRFGLAVEPIPVVSYNGKSVASSEYTVTYIGAKSGTSYTGKAVTTAGQTGYLVLTPSSKSKIFLSVEDDSSLGLYTYGEKEVFGYLKSYKVTDLTLDQLSMGFDTQVESEFTTSSTISELTPYISVNGQKMVAFDVTELRNTLKTKNASKYTTSSAMTSFLNSVAPNTIGGKPVRALYGSYNSNKTTFTATAALVVKAQGQKVGTMQYILQDDFMVSTSSGWKKMFTVSYVSEGKNYMALKSYEYTMNGVKRSQLLFAPGSYQIVLSDAQSLQNGVLGDMRVIEFFIAPKSTFLSWDDNYVVGSSVPGTMYLNFDASTTDIFNGNTVYILKVYKTRSDYEKGTVYKTAKLTYNAADSTRTSDNLTIRSVTGAGGRVYQRYRYYMTGLESGAYYCATVTVSDISNALEIGGKESEPVVFVTNTAQATIDSISYTKKSGASTYTVTAKLNEAASRLESADKSSVTGIKYVLTIYRLNTSTNTYATVQSFTIDNSGRNNALKLTNGTVSFDVAGMKDSEKYIAKLATYLYYNVGTLTSKETSTLCSYANVGTISKPSYVQNTNYKYYLTKEGSLSGSFVSEKVVVNSGDSIPFRASVKNGTASYTYVYTLYQKSGSSYVAYKDGVTTVTTSSTTNVLNWTKTLDAGSYRMIVKITDKNKVSVQYATDFTVKAKLTNTSTLSVTQIAPSTDITVNLSSKNGVSTAKEYIVYLYLPNSSSSVTIQGYSNNTVCTIPANRNTAIGTYRVVVYARDTSGFTSRKELSYKVVSSLINTSSISTTSAYVGDKITVYGSAVGGKGEIKYCLYARKMEVGSTSWGSWYTPQSSYVTTPNLSYTIKVAGTYEFCMKARDSTGVISKVYFTVQTSYAPLENTSTISATNILVGDKFVITPSAMGGKSGYSYTVSYALASSSTFKTVSQSSGRYTISGLAAGNYIIRVKVTDDNKDTAQIEYYVTVFKTTDILKSFSLSVNDKTVTSATNITLGSTVKFLPVAATDNPNVTFACYYKKSADTSWAKATVSSNGVITAKPAKATTYQFKVVATDTLTGLSTESILTCTVVSV